MLQIDKWKHMFLTTYVTSCLSGWSQSKNKFTNTWNELIKQGYPVVGILSVSVFVAQHKWTNWKDNLLSDLLKKLQGEIKDIPYFAV